MLATSPNELDGNLVVGAPGNDDVSELLGGHAELLVGGLHIGQVVVQHLVQAPPQLLCVLYSQKKFIIYLVE